MTSVRPLLPKAEAVTLNRQMDGVYVRGLDNYLLYGTHADIRRKKLNSYLSDAAEQQFLIHNTQHPALQDRGTAAPVPSQTDLDHRVQQRLDTPRWERAYQFKGAVSINGTREHIYVSGKQVCASTREKRPRNHNPYQRILASWRRNSRAAIRMDRAIWLSHPFGSIYFHSFHDVMTQLVLAQELGISADTPVIVPQSWAEQPHGAHFLQCDLLRNRQVVILKPQQTVALNEVFMLQPRHYSKTLLDVVAQSFAEQKPPTLTSDRLVLVRGDHTTSDRSCAQYGDLVATLVNKGFTALDPSTLTLPQQKWVFSRARHIVTENGSALTNIIFRQTGALEIDALISTTFPSVTFQALSKAYGFTFRSHVLPSTRSLNENSGEIIRSELTSEALHTILKHSSQH